ncbi:MAG: phosphate acyltransferase PlsX [bacterium]
MKKKNIENINNVDSRVVKIGIDLMGGDYAPVSTLEGILLALYEIKDLYLKVTYYNKIDYNKLIESFVNKLPKRSMVYNYFKKNLDSEVLNRIEFIPCSSYISMSDKPVNVLKNKDNTLIKVFELLRDGKVDGILYAGNTGAFLETSVLVVGRLNGVKRPALLTVLPFNKPVLLLDSGANAECKSEYLLQFAIMASIYYRKIISNSLPRLGILNIGTENIKGNNLTKESNKLVSNYIRVNNNLFNYVGFVEPYDVVNSKVDIVVCDGFSGNIMLKSFESLGEYVFNFIKKEFSLNIFNRTIGLLSRRIFRKIRSYFDYSEYGGALMIGLNGVSVKTHGRANSRAIKNAILFTYKLILNDINSFILKELESVKNINL